LLNIGRRQNSLKEPGCILHHHGHGQELRQFVFMENYEEVEYNLLNDPITKHPFVKNSS